MFRKNGWLRCVSHGFIVAIMVSTVMATDELSQRETISKILTTESITEMQGLADILSEFAVDDSMVEELISKAMQSRSDAQRVQLWHAIRNTRSQIGREFLLDVLPMTEPSLCIEFLSAMRNPGTFDIPILTAIYQSEPNTHLTDEASLYEFFHRFAFSSWSETRVTDWPSTKNSTLYQAIGKRRKADADAAQIRLLMYLVVHGCDLDSRIAAFDYKGHYWFKGFEPANRQRLAGQLLETAKTSAERARLVFVLLDEIDPSYYLLGAEKLEVKLAAIRAMEKQVEKSWSGSAGYDVLRRNFRYLVPIARDEDYPELSVAARNTIRTLEVRYGEMAEKRPQ